MLISAQIPLRIVLLLPATSAPLDSQESPFPTSILLKVMRRMLVKFTTRLTVVLGLSWGGAFNNQTLWRYQTFTNTAFDNVSSLRFGFRWKNGSSGTQNISFGIDDILVTGTLNVTPTITLSNIPTQVCQNNFLRFNYTVSPALCRGDYSIELLGTSLTWQVNGMTQTSGSFTLMIPTTAPNGLF